MSLRRKFYGAFGLIAILAIGLAVYGAHALSATGDLVARLYDEPLVGVSYARAASATLNEARGLMDRTLLLGPSSSANEVMSLRRMESDIDEDFGIVRARVHDPAVGTALGRAGRAVADWFASGFSILAPPPGGATSVPVRYAVERSSAEAAASLDDLIELVAANGFTYRARARAEIGDASTALAFISAGIIALSALFALLFAHMLIRPIRAATRIAEDVAAGNVTLMAPTRRTDEIGRLLVCLATMQTSLRQRSARADTLLQEKDRAAETLRQTNLRFDNALSNMSHGILMSDAEGHVVVANRRFCDIYGLDPAGLAPGTEYRDVLERSVTVGNHANRPLEALLAEHADIMRSRQPATVMCTAIGGRMISTSYEPMTDGGWIATHEDITERCKSEAQIVFLARHDALTGLPNRVVFQERLLHALAHAERSAGFAVLYLDLDQFKIVNDTLGHPIGDELLCAVALRLRDSVRDGDIVARLGGDEFAIIQMSASLPGEATALARRLVRTLSAPYDLQGNHVVVGVSIGIALAPGDGIHPAQLLKNADLALYRAKREGRGTWRFFEAAMDSAAQARRVLELDLRHDDLLQQLELYYQPVVCSRTRHVRGFEALLRWHHPMRGVVLPNDFISVAEEIGMIVPIGAWVLQQACATASTWQDHLKVAVNLSPVQFRGRALVAAVAEAVRRSGIAPSRLELEITEGVLLEENSANLSVLHDLRDLGVRISMDDFGTGHSSLSYLRSFPFDTIKIDRSFVIDLTTRDECLAIVRAVTGLASSLHMNTIAEGVETEAQFAMLAAEGCTEVQGYLFSKPVPVRELPALFARLCASRSPGPGVMSLAS
jgi:diguanylate cyclase (GGDEF)-like protein